MADMGIIAQSVAGGRFRAGAGVGEEESEEDVEP
jgi:hypothetical protein